MVAEKVAMSLYKNRGQTDIAECPLLVRIIMIHVSFNIKIEGKPILRNALF